MTYQELLDELNDMTDEQLKQPVVISYNDEWVHPEVIAVVKKDYTDGEEGSDTTFAPFQTILM